MSKIPFRFAPIPDDMLFDPDVPAEVSVLWAAIYRLTDRHGTAAIGQLELGTALGWSVATVRRNVRKAETCGVIHTSRRGKTLPNEYTAVLRERSDVSAQCDDSERSPLSEVSGHTSSIERSNKRETRDDDFGTWYQEYPVHKARGDAEKAWRQMNGTRPALDALLAATRSYAMTDLVKRGFGKHPATWLRAKCWLDEESNGHGPPMERCPKCDTGWGDDSVCFARGCPMMVTT